MKRGTWCLQMIAILPLLGGWGVLEKRNRAVEQGNAQMKAGKPAEALAHYDRALAELPADRGVNFDRGTALAALGRHDEALQEFLRATEARSTPLKASAFYNLGNAFYKSEKFGEAAEAYKRSLALDPRNVQAKWNLELALRRKKTEDEKKKSDDQKQSSKDPGKPDQPDKAGNKPPEDPSQQEPADKDKQEQAKEPPPDRSQGSQDQQEQQDDKDKQANAGKPGDKSAEQREMDAVLDNLERSPRELEQVRARLRALRRQPPEKDW